MIYPGGFSVFWRVEPESGRRSLQIPVPCVRYLFKNFKNPTISTILNRFETIELSRIWMHDFWRRRVFSVCVQLEKPIETPS